MNNEIKEILDELLFTTTLPNVSIKLNEEKINQLKDYITNLHQEINKLIAESTEWESKCYDLQQENKRLKEWKEDTKKKYVELENIKKEAIDKIQYIIDYGFDYDGFNTVESLKGLIDMLVDYARESKNILQNGDNNND